MNGLDPVALDRHITGNYGEDFFKDQYDMETCSWCTTEVPDIELKETEDGARLCSECWADYEDRTNPNRPEEGTDE